MAGGCIAGDLAGVGVAKPVAVGVEEEVREAQSLVGLVVAVVVLVVTGLVVAGKVGPELGPL